MPQLEMVPLSKIWWDKRFREDLGDIESLVESIREKGVLQPITVRRDYKLLSGERRVTAARAAGLAEIPALVRDSEGDIDDREVELIENIVRKDFTWHERVALVSELHELCKSKNIDWSGRKTAQLLNRGHSEVARELELAEALKDMPELQELPTERDAYKALKKFEEQVIVRALRERQQTAVLDRGLRTMLDIADSNYRIGDTFKGLAELRSEGNVHIIECDPPYSVDLPRVKYNSDRADSNVKTYNELPSDEYPAFLRRLAAELFRVAGRNCWLIFWFGPSWWSEVKTALLAAGWQVDEMPAVWIKRQGQTLHPTINLARAYELFFVCRKGEPAIIKQGRLNVFDFPALAPTKKYHPTERPVPLMEEILQTFGAPRQTVLVPFLGSGATLRAAYNCGMQGFGWEINPEYKDHFMVAVENDTKALDESNND